MPYLDVPDLFSAARARHRLAHVLHAAQAFRYFDWSSKATG
jgi:hypothetical protein